MSAVIRSSCVIVGPVRKIYTDLCPAAVYRQRVESTAAAAAAGVAPLFIWRKSDVRPASDVGVDVSQSS